ncbi:hypothetical protein NP493_1597g00006 [Ridgeia piscesae]|uniref:Uncharacterized protein n=1 Tax=Ridgeia piscesae TaxID=27915 RepID=A0AAD9JZA0_RIDPI|nr:hypothetical protein NP493_1597g00006 [Ridgeia piscesae]
MILGNFGAFGTHWTHFGCKLYDRWRLEYAELALKARGWSAKYNFNKWFGCKKYKSCGRDGEKAREKGGSHNEGGSAEESGSAEEGGSDEESGNAKEGGSGEKGEKKKAEVPK